MGHRVVSPHLDSQGLCLLLFPFLFPMDLLLSSASVSSREIFPYLVVVIGLENVLVLTKSVVSTPVDLEVKLRIAQGEIQLWENWEKPRLGEGEWSHPALMETRWLVQPFVLNSKITMLLLWALVFWDC